MSKVVEYLVYQTDRCAILGCLARERGGRFCIDHAYPFIEWTDHETTNVSAERLWEIMRQHGFVDGPMSAAPWGIRERVQAMARTLEWSVARSEEKRDFR